MATATWTVADLLEHFGPIPAVRIRQHPAPGTATEQDVIDIEAREDRLCELVDGVLVEKAMGYHESQLAIWLGYFIADFLKDNDLGIIAGADGMMRLAPGLVRLPDVSFVSWDRFPNREVPDDPIADLGPDLAVEVLSESNTKKEMDRKLVEYFEAGARLVWYVDPRTRNIEVYTSPEKCVTLGEDRTLDGGEVLPGFTLSIRELFERAARNRPSE